MRGAITPITVWHKTREGFTDTWLRTTINKVIWESDTIRAINDGIAVFASAYSILIPWPVVTDIIPGDLIAQGEHDEEITNMEPYTINKIRESLLPNVFIVKSVAKLDQSYKRSPHWEISGV